MYPNGELTRLARHKAALLDDIAVHRAACVTAAHHALRPLQWADRVLALWRRVAPLVSSTAGPLGLLLARVACSHRPFLQRVLSWAPLAVSALHLRAWFGARRAGS